MYTLTKLVGALLVISQLSGCAAAVVGSAAAGGSMAVDRRTAGAYVEDENIELKAKAETLAKSIAGVKNITNEIVIGMKSSLSDRTNDTFITSKVKANFLAEKDFHDHLVKVVTEASTVYLMGIVTQKEANLAVEITRNTDGVKKVVKVFEYMP